jgi:hypothetical protein
MEGAVTDSEMARYLNLTADEAAIIMPSLTPERRALYERMHQVEIEAALWVQGLGPKPAGVLLDTERSVRRRPTWRGNGR